MGYVDHVDYPVDVVAKWVSSYVGAPACTTVEQVASRLAINGERLKWMGSWTAKKLVPLFATHNIRTVLEIGHLCGVSTAYFAVLVKSRGGHVVTIDLPRAEQRLPSAEQSLRVCGLQAEIIRVPEGSNVVCPPMIEAGRQFDFVYVDGCHTSPQVDKDWEYAKQLVKDGGLVMFDDIQPEWPEVLALWENVVVKDPCVSRAFNVTGTQYAAVVRRGGDGEKST